MSTPDDTIYKATELINKQNLGRAGNLFAYIHDPAHANRIAKGGMVVAGTGAVGLAAWGLNHRIAVGTTPPADASRTAGTDPAARTGHSANADAATGTGQAANADATGTGQAVNDDPAPAGTALPALGAARPPVPAAPPLQLNPQVPVVDTVDDLSFAEAFGQARDELGPGAIFLWQGKAYNTFLEREWEDLGSEGQQEYIRSLVVEHEEYYDQWADGAEAVPDPAPIDAVYHLYVWDVTAVFTEAAPAPLPADEAAGAQAAGSADAYEAPAYEEPPSPPDPDYDSGTEGLPYGAGGAEV